MPTSAVAKAGNKPEQLVDLRNPRVKRTLQESIRTKIQVSQILQFVQNHVLGVEGYEDVKPTRLIYGMKLIDKILPNAIPDAVTTNLQANTALALSSINQAQLMAMAREMLANQGLSTPVDAAPVEMLVDTNSGLSGGGVGMTGVGGGEDVSHPAAAQESSDLYLTPNTPPDHMG